MVRATALFPLSSRCPLQALNLLVDFSSSGLQILPSRGSYALHPTANPLCCFPKMTQFDWPWPEEILNGPACPSPDGTYNFDVRPPHNVGAYVLITICAALTAVAASLRAYSRLSVTKKVYLEDCTC